MLKHGETKRKYLYCDLAALALGLVLFGFLALTAKNGVSAPDESFYYTVTQRLLLGEKLIADEWNVAQLVHLLNVLPYFAYTRVTGGTEGVILFMRYLFIAIDAIFYAYVYKKLRVYRGWGAAAALAFCLVIPQTMLSIAYFTAAPMAVLAFCLILITDGRERKTPVLLFAGVLLACAILAEPYLIAGFLAWFFTVVLREILKKKDKPFLTAFDFILSGRVFIGVTAGAVAVFIPFMLYMTLGGAFENFTTAFRYMASGSEIDLLGTVLLKKSLAGAKYFGYPFAVCQLAALAAAVILRLKKNKNTRMRRAILIGAAAALAAGYAYAGIKTLSTKDTDVWVAFAEYHNFSFLFFSPIPFLLAEKPQPRLTAFWAVGAVFNLLVDASSAVFLGSGAGLMRAATLLRLSVLLPELKRESAPDKTKKAPAKNAGRAFRAGIAVCAAAAIWWHAGYYAGETVYKPVEKMFEHAEGPLNAELRTGPFKGLKTTAAVAEIYEKTLEDLDGVREKAAGRPVAVLDLAPYTYLYLNGPYGAYTAWFEYYETERLAAFWALRPARQPAYIYLPFYEKGLLAPYLEEILQLKLELLAPFAEGEIERGRAGYIIRVTKLNLPEIEG